MLFLLRQRLVLIPSVVASLLCAFALVSMTIANGKGTPQTLFLICAISVLCGIGATVIVVGPVFMIYR